MEITGNRGTKKTAYIGFLFEMVYVILCGFKNLEHQQVFENDEDKTFKYTKIAHLLDIFYKGRPVQFDISLHLKSKKTGSSGQRIRNIPPGIKWP